MNSDLIPPLRVYIGYDSREEIAYEICKHSILKYAPDVEIVKLDRQVLMDNKIFARDLTEAGSTEFTYTRFFVPMLNGYRGWAIFVDCDFLFMQDIRQVLQHANPRNAVMVCQHDYKPTDKVKMDGQKQSTYPRKNWSSFILWNNWHSANQSLNINNLNESTNYDGSYLHQFKWLKNDEIGELPLIWNWLEGWYKDSVDIGAYHYTRGGPWFDNWMDCDFAEHWLNALHEWAIANPDKLHILPDHLKKIV